MKKVNIFTPNFDLDQRMLHIVMQHSSSTSDLGLLSGKMGLILFFSHFYRNTSNDIYEAIADDLMDEVLKKIHKKLPINFDSGLTGIGWAIEYLIHNKFMDGDSLEVCEEIDKLIMQTDPRRLENLSLETGLEGLLHYILAHIQGAKGQTGTLPFDSIYLEDIYSAVSILEKTEINKDLRTLVNKYIRFYQGKEFKYDMNIRLFLRKRKISEKKLLSTPIGIKSGISGVLLNKILS